MTVDESYRNCETLTRRAAKNFYPAFTVLPRAQRKAMCALYAFCRISDDLADAPLDAPTRRQSLDRWRSDVQRNLDSPQDHPVLLAFSDTVNRFSVPRRYVNDIIDGVMMDLDAVRYSTFAELRKYCYHVASAVGLCSIHIWGFHGPDAERHAEEAGIALQLTNILRDLREDYANGRVYIPEEDWRRFDCRPETMAADDPAFQAMMRFQVERARGCYESAKKLAAVLNPSGRAVFSILLGTYQALLDRIEAVNYDVLSGRVRVSRWKKWALVARAAPVKWGWWDG